MSASDDVRRWSDELAGYPASMVFLPLGEALRTGGQTDLALRVAVRGLERHPYDADAHDLLARICVDRGEVERALDEWDASLRCAPEHVGALKGMGFVCFSQGRLAGAEHYLGRAAVGSPDDDGLASALARVREELAPSPDAPVPEAPVDVPPAAPADVRDDSEVDEHPAESAGTAEHVRERVGDATHHNGSRANGSRSKVDEMETFIGDPRQLFGDLIGAADQAALLLDEDGLVMAGQYIVAGGADVGAEVGAALTGVSDEARRAMRHLPLGEWRTIVFETAAATIAMTPAPHDGLVLVAAAPSVPSGLVRRSLERVAERARRWIEGLA